MKIRPFFFITATILLIGAGCSGGTNSNNNGGSTSTPGTVIKKPTVVTVEEQAYEQCLVKGYSVGIQEENGINVSYCVFANGTACPLLLFGNGSCSISSGAVVYDSDAAEELQQIRACDETSPSVCGENYKTYVNRCIAELQQVAVLHEGDCTPEEIASLSPQAEPQTVLPAKKQSTKSSSKSGSGSSGSSGGSSSGGQTDTPTPTPQPLPPSSEIPNTPAAQAEWLSMLIDITLSGGPTNPRSFIEQCTFGKTVVYYYQQGSDTSFSTLYNKEGEVLCFPNNDVNNSCPSYFDKSTRSGNCTQIWKDKR